MLLPLTGVSIELQAFLHTAHETELSTWSYVYWVACRTGLNFVENFAPQQTTERAWFKAWSAPLMTAVTRHPRILPVWLD
jgi:hypothetical protein